MNEYDETDPQQGNWVSKLRKDNKALKTQVSELTERLARAENKATAKDLGQAFAFRGLDPRLIKFYQGESTDEAIDNWVEENEGLLFVREASSEDTTVAASDQETWEFMRELTSARKQALDLESRLKEAETEEDVLKLLEEAESIEIPNMPF